VIDIHFEFDQGKADRDAQAYSPCGPHAGDLSYWLFVFRAALTVGSTNVLRRSDSPNPRIPITKMAMDLSRAVRLARAGIASAPDLAGAYFEPIEFHPQGDSVVIKNPGEGVEVVTSLAELSEAVERYSDEVRTLLLRLIPSVVSDEHVGWWFRAEPPPEGWENVPWLRL
jgi:hypothetical protein